MATNPGSGIIPPLVTPINADESVNYEQLGRIIDHVVDGGANAVFVAGSTGEFPRFAHETRDRIVAETVRLAARRVPVFAGVGDAGLALVKRNIAAAEKAGADVLVVPLPYYYPVRTDGEAHAFFKAVAAAASLPVMLYNIPGTCGASIGLDVAERLADIDNVVGIKDSGGDLPRLLETIRRLKGRRKDFAVVVGAEELCYEGLKNGADGVVPSMANPFPRLFAEMYRAALSHDDGRLRELCDLVDAMNHENNFSDSWLTAIVWRKKAMAHMGLCDGRCTEPYVPADAKADANVMKCVERYRRLFPK
ncbi:MAG: dihydrodipicolinate synthase family protein [Planctomycetota bacterium]|nr:dihydrodipicolinate synthase family protein [Planctomycetota bacterium]